MSYTDTEFSEVYAVEYGDTEDGLMLTAPAYTRSLVEAQANRFRNTSGWAIARVRTFTLTALVDPTPDQNEEAA